MQDEKEPRFFKHLKRYSVWFGTGAWAALQFLKTDMLSFPAAWKIYIAYFFSIIVIICVFLAGPSIGEMVKKLNAVMRQMADNKKTQDGNNDPS